MIALAARNAASISISEVSSKCASAAGFNGESARPMSRSSRRVDVGEDFGEIGLAAVAFDLVEPAPGAHLGARRDVELHVGIGADHRADVAAVEHRAGRLSGEVALLFDQDAPHARDDRHLRGRLADRMRRQHGAVELRQIDLARRGLGGRGVVQRQAVRQQRMRDGAVGQAGVEMVEVIVVGKPARQRALAGAGGPVDGDDQRPFTRPASMTSISAPSPAISPMNSGKLVAIIAWSSMVTGFSVASPSTRKAHGDAVVEMRREPVPPPSPLPPGRPRTASVASPLGAVDAIGLQPVRRPPTAGRIP